MDNTSAILIFYIPCPDSATAEKLSHQLLDLKLIACSNIMAGSCLYEWKGSVSEEDEIFLIAKTVLQNEKVVESFVTEAHPYELPCIARWEARVNRAYYDWVEKACGS